MRFTTCRNKNSYLRNLEKNKGSPLYNGYYLPGFFLGIFTTNSEFPYAEDPRSTRYSTRSTSFLATAGHRWESYTNSFLNCTACSKTVLDQGFLFFGKIPGFWTSSFDMQTSSFWVWMTFLPHLRLNGKAPQYASQEQILSWQRLQQQQQIIGRITNQTCFPDRRISIKKQE